MSRPKLTRILQTVASRLQVISQDDGYYTDIGRSIRLDMREPQADDLPCCLVTMGERTLESNSGCTDRIDMEITVVGYMPLIDQAYIQGDEILSDIQRAVELEDSTLGGLLRRQFGLAFLSSEIYMPEIGANAVGARVTYSAPHVRVTGDPEIA